MSELREILDRLGLSQYLGRLIEEGFDRWDTILDIQETDLAYMGFKLGHRRVLQRAIARDRGIPEHEPIPWLCPQPFSEDPSDEPDDNSSPRGFRPDYKGVVQTKRKYRRHPRPDENAPEKPPSAYVMFANNVREELKGQNLSFTEIARLVGERWKVLPPEQKEEYEYRAGVMKDRYNQELAAYKKTDQFKEYSQYLLEFKSKEAAKEAGEASFNPTADIPRKRPNITSTGGQVPQPNQSRTQQQQDASGSPSYPQPTSMAIGQYSSQHGRRESYHSPFTQPSTPASQMSGPPESVMLPFRDSPGRSNHGHFYEPTRTHPPHGGGHPETFDQGPGLMQLPKINQQPPHIQQVLSYSRGQPSPGDSPSQNPRRSGSISGMSYTQQRPALHPSDTLSTQNSMSSRSSSVPSLTSTTSSDGDGRQMHTHNSLRALPPLRGPSPSQGGSSSYFTQRPTRDMGGSGGGGPGSGTGYPGHGSTSSSPRSQLPSLAEQTMQDPPRRGGDGADHS
ncbi:uncharacterized protein DFL_007930 [Arthrobotrys flagrans]|uniref:HMG box domain-containing protein n=1 Tax=Arthrobotrys flagrans TaxID=97331 RepID=A0A436ZXT4_ARTFL|nr:hypothetical protein DFL_007930 [Arthrobotrys flagrans]